MMSARRRSSSRNIGPAVPTDGDDLAARGDGGGDAPDALVDLFEALGPAGPAHVVERLRARAARGARRAAGSTISATRPSRSPRGIDGEQHARGRAGVDRHRLAGVELQAHRVARLGAVDAVRERAAAAADQDGLVDVVAQRHDVRAGDLDERGAGRGDAAGRARRCAR